MPLADLFQLLVAAPWPNRHFVPLLHHVLQSRINDELLLQVQDSECLPHFLTRFDKYLRPLLKDVAFGDGMIIAPPVYRVFNLLIPPARFEMPTSELELKLRIDFGQEEYW